MAALDGGPDWIREAWRVFWEETRRYVSTMLAICTRPRIFAQQWVTGETVALNPLGFLATSLGIAGIVIALLPSQDEHLIDQISRTVLPYGYYATLGILAHPIVRRRTLRATLAVSLFAGGGPGLISVLGVISAFALRQHFYPNRSVGLMRDIPSTAAWIFGAMVFPPTFWLLATLVNGLAGAHGRSRRRALLAVCFAVFAAGVPLGWLHDHFHFEIGVTHVTIGFNERLGPLHIPFPDLWL